MKQLVLMGGHIEPPSPESNVTCDPAAAEYLIARPVNKLLVPLDVTMLCKYRQHHRKDLEAASNARAQLIRDFIRAWQLGRHQGNPMAEPILHDPLAVTLAFEPSFITRREPMHIAVRISEGQVVLLPIRGREPNAEVVLGLDVERFERFFANRIMSAVR